MDNRLGDRLGTAWMLYRHHQVAREVDQYIATHKPWIRSKMQNQWLTETKNRNTRSMV